MINNVVLKTDRLVYYEQVMNLKRGEGVSSRSRSRWYLELRGEK